MDAISTARITLLRACYLLLVIGLATKFWPVVVGNIATLPRMEGVVTALLGALGLLSIIGLFSPVRMIPLLLFEIVWKAVWALTVALPHWQSGTLDDGMAATLFACAWAIPFVFIIPWTHVARTYLGSAELGGPPRKLS
jgi:hypothetical protein